MSGQVAQFLRINQDPTFARGQVKAQLRAELLRRHKVPPDMTTASLGKLLRTVGDQRRETNADDSYQLLAELPARVYICATPDNLLGQALKAAGRTADVEFCGWRKTKQETPPYDKEPHSAYPCFCNRLTDKVLRDWLQQSGKGAK